MANQQYIGMRLDFMMKLHSILGKLAQFKLSIGVQDLDIVVDMLTGYAKFLQVKNSCLFDIRPRIAPIYIYNYGHRYAIDELLNRQKIP